MSFRARRSRGRRGGFGANVGEYGMNHRPPEDGPPLYDLLEGGLAPRDIYEHPEWYTGFPEDIWETASAMRRLRGESQLRRADGKIYGRIRIYRAGPTSELNPGDWVTLSQKYAIDHRNSIDPVKYKVCSFLVEARYVRWAGDDLMEWGYWGPASKGAWGTCAKSSQYRAK